MPHRAVLPTHQGLAGCGSIRGRKLRDFVVEDGAETVLVEFLQEQAPWW